MRPDSAGDTRLQDRIAVQKIATVPMWMGYVLADAYQRGPRTCDIFNPVRHIVTMTGHAALCSLMTEVRS